jgi:hypothetical protein
MIFASLSTDIGNPVRKVKFFKEFTTGARIVSPEEEERLIRNAAPFMQDLIRFEYRLACRGYWVIEAGSIH